MSRNLREVYERLKRQTNINDENELRRRAWVETNKMLYESSAGDGGPGAGAGAGGGGGSGNRRTEIGTNIDDFIIRIDTRFITNRPTNEMSLVINGEDILINWGDGNTETWSNNDTTEIFHTYSTPGIYNISISNKITTIRSISSNQNRNKIIDILQWGTAKWTTFGNAFYGCSGLKVISCKDVPDLSLVDSLGGMFQLCGNLISVNKINEWDLSGISDISGMFNSATSFNQDISSWDVSNVTNMLGLFGRAISFNQNIGNWNTSNVVDMRSVFFEALSFNQDISGWDVSNVTNMGLMFQSAQSFNQDISGWDVSKVTNMERMFFGAISFNQDISGWDVSNVTNMTRMLLDANSFAQDLSSWNVNIEYPIEFISVFDGTLFLPEFLPDPWKSIIWVNSDITNTDLTLLLSINSFTFSLELQQGSGVTYSSFIFYPFNTNIDLLYTDSSYDLKTIPISGLTEVIDSNDFVMRTHPHDGIFSTGSIISSLIFPPHSDNITININSNGAFFDTSGDTYGVFCDFPTEYNVYENQNAEYTGSYPFYIDSGTFSQDDSEFGSCGDINPFVFILNIESTENNIDVSSFFDVENTDYVVDWGDGQFSRYDDYEPHTYSSTGTYSVRIINSDVYLPDRFLFTYELVDKYVSWGQLTYLPQNSRYLFSGEVDLNDVTGTLDTSLATDMSYMFENNTIVSDIDLSGWDVSGVSDMSYMFSGASNFNGNITSWVVSNVVNMSYMFRGASSFDQDLSSWFVVNGAYLIENMSYMFENASSFNQDISGWDVSTVTDFSGMLSGATSFNQNLSSWPTTSDYYDSSFVDPLTFAAENLPDPWKVTVNVAITSLNVGGDFSLFDPITSENIGEEGTNFGDRNLTIYLYPNTTVGYLLNFNVSSHTQSISDFGWQGEISWEIDSPSESDTTGILDFKYSDFDNTISGNTTNFVDPGGNLDITVNIQGAEYDTNNTQEGCFESNPIFVNENINGNYTGEWKYSDGTNVYNDSIEPLVPCPE